MKITCFITLLITSLTLSASLDLINYDPLLFRLTFSSPVHKPQFQILMNNIIQVPSKIISSASPSNNFTIQATIISTNLQQYELMFNTPLTIGDGDLDIQSYYIKAKKIPVHVQFSHSFSIILLVIIYLLGIFTHLGILMIQFTQIFLLFSFINSNSTSFFQDLYSGLLVIPPSQILNKMSLDMSIQKYLMRCTYIPLILIAITASLGLASKKIIKGERSITKNIIYQFFTYGLFLKIFDIFTFNLLYNSIQFFKIISENIISISESTKGFISYLSYLNICLLISITYLKIYILNPKIGQKEESWKKYIKSQQFLDFKSIHEGLYLDTIIKRNFQVKNTIKNVLIICMFFISSFFQYFLFLMQFANLYILFTTKPYKEQFYRNSKVILRILIIFQYLIILIGNRFYSLGQITNNSSSIYSFLISIIIVFLIIQLIITMAIFAEIYFKCSNLNYEIKFVKQANQFKLELIQKNKQDRQSTINRKPQTTIFSQNNSQKKQRKTVHSSDKKHKKITEDNPKDTLLEKQYLDISPNRPKRSRSKTKISIQMTDFTQDNRVRNGSGGSPIKIVKQRQSSPLGIQKKQQ